MKSTMSSFFFPLFVSCSVLNCLSSNNIPTAYLCVRFSCVPCPALLLPLSRPGNPLPSVIHKVIQHDDLGPGRLVLVGDVHGCLDELNELLDKLEFRHGHDNLVLVGDLVNKGPKSQQVCYTDGSLTVARCSLQGLQA